MYGDFLESPVYFYLPVLLQDKEIWRSAFTASGFEAPLSWQKVGVGLAGSANGPAQSS